ncbi:MAG: ABC transporter ATP-binding protein, partial [Candidatus Dormibacteria bacterium]
MRSVEIRALGKAFGASVVLRDLDLEIEEGSLTAILGPSGSGKTTLLRLIAGLERADRGEIRLRGRVVDDGRRSLPPERRLVGYVPQDAGLFPHLTALQNVGFGLRRGQRGARSEALLEMVGLNGLGDRFPHQLSGGQQQRVALARALAIDPELLLLDEPFSGLDPTLRAAVREEVRRILTETKKTTILVTHDQEEALATADQLALLRRGRVTQFGSPHALYADPVDLDTARFLGDANLVRGTLESGAVTTPLGQLRLRPGPAPRDGPVLALVRPEQIAISATAPGACSAQVVRTEFYGHDSLVEL